MDNLKDIIFNNFDTLDWGYFGIGFSGLAENLFCLIAGALVVTLPFALIIKICRGLS